MAESAHEVQRLFKLLVADLPARAFLSPPDIFAVCSYFAKVTGCYRAHAHGGTSLRDAVSSAVATGQAWRLAIDRLPEPPLADIPAEIIRWFQQIQDVIAVPLETLVNDSNFVEACLSLIVACDAACEGIGVPSGPSKSYFEALSEIRLGEGTLCRFIPGNSLRVLPKQHTPRPGFTLRSLTHHLALCSASEVTPVWSQIPSYTRKGASYNILLAPWPLEMEAADFRPSRSHNSRTKGFGYFDYSPRRGSSVATVRAWTKALFRQAKRIGQHVDLVVFPEAALTHDQWDAICDITVGEGASLIAGVRGSIPKSSLNENSLRFMGPFPWLAEEVQHKHHRWRIDEQQISSYGLGGTLGRETVWWENIQITDRRLNFWAILPDLVVCPLICEDLARQDPVAEIVRSVGPNLVIALLMDGPQLGSRWSARYASVLADDPGSSVLTISSLGMVGRCRPVGCAVSRVFASWREPTGAFVPLELAASESAMLMNLQFRPEEECSVDGRLDGGAATAPILCGTHGLTVG